ncbi:heavy metal translocating P-type ATPase [Aureimonas ureilytica]|uniref:heavy metal translocating P-type ATPase n=1 Tax=Aureimonas ureilytica TaxID=401562 RepID=UPI0003650232|nr:heavy metal translocating P-type ATPase [Aureimonas ureilytica]
MNETLPTRHLSSASPSRLTLPVEGMSCASCVGRVERALRALPDVTEASVNLATGEASLRFAGEADAAAAVRAIEEAGYDVPPRRIALSVEGMSCASCVGRVERALRALPGVGEATVNLATGQAHVTASPALAPADLVAAVEEAGYDARLEGDTPPQARRDERAARADAETRGLKHRALLALALAAPLFVVEMGGHLVPALHHAVAGTIGMETSWRIQAVLATLVLFGPGLRFYRIGLPLLIKGAPDMNSLVAIGTLAAYSYSLVATFAPALLPAEAVHVYYEAASVIVALVLIGRWMEARARGRTGQAIRALAKLQPAEAERIGADGQSQRVPIDALRAGDLVAIRPGERVPADGRVEEGASFVDEAMLTGEPAPVRKESGAALTGGTVNGAGALTLRVEKVGGDTVLSGILRMVEEAQGGKLPIQALVDRVTLWFVPAVIAAALATFALWLALGPTPALPHALSAAVAVLIIACPCAMGLATPTSILVGTGRAARQGILFRRGEALQALGDARIVAFDKTGTLTLGRPTLERIQTAPGFDANEALRLSASAEARSEHPIAHALLDAAKARGLALAPVTGAEALPGFGLRAEVEGRRVEIGARRFMERLGLDAAPFDAQAQALAESGATPLFLALDGQLAALLAVSDPIREEAADAIAALKREGLRTALVSGDDRRTAEAVARKLGIDETVAEVLPEGKVEAIRRLQREHGPVLFVGDGINDAPALAAAEIGMAVGSGTDVAIEAADIVLVAPSPGNVPRALRLSRSVLGNIRQNLGWAFGYNVLLIPVAAGALYPAFGLLLSPVWAAAAMGLSSTLVLLNGLRSGRGD